MSLALDDPLGRGARRFLLLHHLWLVGANLSGTFVNAFLFRARGELAPVAVYNLALYAAIPAGAAVAGWLMGRSNRLAIWRWGVAVHGALYALMLAGGQRAAGVPALAGALAGLAAGLYWLAFAVIAYDHTAPRNRGRFFGLQGALTAAVNTLAPAAAGLFIGRMGAGRGYGLVFATSLATFALALGVSWPLRASGEGRGWRAAALWPGAGTPAPWRTMLLAHLLVGLREGTHWFLPALLLFAATRSEALLGRLAFGVGGLGGLAAYAAGRVPRRRQLAAMAAGAAGLAAMPGLLAFAGLRPGVLVVYALLVAVLAQFFYVPWSAVALDVMEGAPWCRAHRVECLVAREGALGAGRVAAVAAFLLAAGPSPPPERHVLILAVSAPLVLLGAALVRRAGVPGPGGP